MNELEDIIDQGIRDYRKRKKRHPEYLILDRQSYEEVKRSRSIPDYEEMSHFKGMMIHIRPVKERQVEFL